MKRKKTEQDWNIFILQPDMLSFKSFKQLHNKMCPRSCKNNTSANAIGFQGVNNKKENGTTQGDCINIEEYTSWVTSYISNCVDDVVITKTMKSYPNQKTWMNGEVRPYPDPRKMPCSQVTSKCTTPPERDWKLDNIPASWNLTSLQSEPTNPQRMPSPLPSISHALKITNPPSEYFCWF